MAETVKLDARIFSVSQSTYIIREDIEFRTDLEDFV